MSTDLNLFKIYKKTTKFTTTLKKSFQIGLKRYFEENEYVILVIAHFVPILKCQNLLTELLFFC